MQQVQVQSTHQPKNTKFQKLTNMEDVVDLLSNLPNQIFHLHKKRTQVGKVQKENQE